MLFAIFRNKLEVDNTINNNVLNLSECNIIPLTPHVIDKLDILNYEYTLPGEFVSIDYELIYKIFIFIWTKADSSIKNEIKLIYNEDIELLCAQTHFNRILINSYIYCLYILYYIETNYEDAKVFVYYYNEDDIISNLFDEIKSQNTLWANKFILDTSLELKANDDEYKSLKIDMINNLDKVNNHTSILILLKSIIKSFINFSNSAKINDLISSYYCKLNYHKTFKYILVLSSSPETNYFVSVLQNTSNYKVIYWELLNSSHMNDKRFTYKNNSSSNSKIQNIIRTLNINESDCIYNLKILPLLKPFIEDKIKNEIQVIVNNIKLFTYLINIFKINLVLTGHELSLYEYLIKKANELKIKTIVLLHGGTTGYLKKRTPMPEYTRRWKNDFVYNGVYTENIKKYLIDGKIIYNNNTRHIVTGSIYFEKLFENTKNRKNKYSFNRRNIMNVCYVVNNINNFMSIGQSSQNGNNNITNMYCTMNKIVKKFSEANNIKLTVKFGRNIEKNNYKLFRNIQNMMTISNVNYCKSDTKISSLLLKYDLFIIDGPSTPFCELLVSHSPIIAYFDPTFNELTDEAYDLIKNRVKIVLSKKEYMDNIDDVINMGFKAPIFHKFTSTDLQFYKQFCWDGVSTKKRIVSCINNLNI